MLISNLTYVLVINYSFVYTISSYILPWFVTKMGNVYSVRCNKNIDILDESRRSLIICNGLVSRDQSCERRRPHGRAPSSRILMPCSVIVIVFQL